MIKDDGYAKRLASILMQNHGAPTAPPGHDDIVFLLRLLDSREKDDGYARGLMAAANLCADRAIDLRDYGPKSREGLLTAAAGAHVGVWLEAELAIRALLRGEG